VYFVPVMGPIAYVMKEALSVSLCVFRAPLHPDTKLTSCTVGQLVQTWQAAQRNSRHAASIPMMKVAGCNARLIGAVILARCVI
jgi:hypothetical protein